MPPIALVVHQTLQRSCIDVESLCQVTRLATAVVKHMIVTIIHITSPPPQKKILFVSGVRPKIFKGGRPS